MTLQHSHKSTPFSPKQFPIILICDGIKSPANIGGLFRICEAFGVSEVIFGAGRFDINSARIQRTSRGTHLKVPYSQVTDISDIIQQLKDQQYKVIALEITQTSILIENLSFNPTDKIALIVGSEQQGISEELLEATTLHAHIEMFGNNSSMNAVQATGIALYILTKTIGRE